MTPLYGQDAVKMAEKRNRLLRTFHDEEDRFNPPPHLADNWKSILCGGEIYYALDLNDGPQSGGWPIKEEVKIYETNIDPLIMAFKSFYKTDNDYLISTIDFSYDYDLYESLALYSTCKPDPQSIYDSFDFMRYVQFGSDVYELNRYGLQILQGILIDPNENWIAIEVDDCGYLLCGEGPFIDHYCNLVGGLDLVQARYYHWLYHHGPTVYYKDWALSDWEKELLNSIGWPEPNPKVIENWHETKDCDWSPMFGDAIRSYGPEDPAHALECLS